MKKTKALFLDLDGTVIKSSSGKQFIEDEFDVELYDGIEERIWAYKDNGYYIFGVTNQGGVAFGIKSEEEHGFILDEMRLLFDEDPFDHIETAFYHENGRMNKSPLCNGWHPSLRKPDTGMLYTCLQLVNPYDYEHTPFVEWFDIDRSLMVGDRREDRDCATKFGIRFQTARIFRNTQITVNNSKESIMRPVKKTDMHVQKRAEYNYEITAASIEAVVFIHSLGQEFGPLTVMDANDFRTKFALTISPVYDVTDVVSYIEGYKDAK